jgi:hypothetical protein
MKKPHCMNSPLLNHPGPLAIDLNHPGTYLHWSIFEISVANLVVIAVMVAIFGAALLLPFPHGQRAAPAGAEVSGIPDSEPAQGLGEDADSRMWTNRVRRRAVRMLPPDKLLPDRQAADSSTARTCGASSCSWRSWSSTCGASSGWPRGAAAGR